MYRIKIIIFICCTFGLLCCTNVSTQNDFRRQLDSLNEKINQSKNYDTVKEQQIASLKAVPSTNFFDKYLKLYEAYKFYNFDSAYQYASLLLKQASLEKNDSLYECAKLKQCFILVSSGMFKEALDSLNTIRPAQLKPSFKIDYYTALMRCYYDLADYDNDYYSAEYNKTGSQYLDSLLVCYPADSFESVYYKGLKEIRLGNFDDKALQYLQPLISKPLSLHQMALTTSTLSDIYIRHGETDAAIRLLAKGAIADIESSTKETTALFNLSTLLYKNGDLKTASFYIKKAMNDAVFYGAKQRKVQLSSVLALIENQHVASVEQQKRNAIMYGILTTLLLLILAGAVVTVIRQIRKLKKAEQTINKVHHHLQEVNVKLEEANKIKEEYLGFFFNGNSEVYTKVERFKRNIEKKVRDRKLDEILFLLNNFNLNEDKHELLDNFDRIFLKIFPHFLQEYNALFPPECQTALKDDEHPLPTEVRIFALIRLGIHENEKIAEILGYSVHTINTYKTKTKNKSLVENEQFEKKIMQIPSV